MRRLLTIVILFSLYLLHASNNSRLEFIYEYNNPTLGPIDGYHNAEVKIENLKVVLVKDLQSGKVYRDYYSKFPEISAILDILKGNTKGYIVKYNTNKLPVTIISKKIGYEININYKLYKTSIKKEYEEALKRWQSNRPKHYRYVYQIKIDNKLKSAIEVTIKDGKIVKAKDENLHKLIDKKSILTLDKIFNYTKLAIDSNSLERVFFDKKIGYVKFLKYLAKNGSIVEIIVFNFVKVE